MTELCDLMNKFGSDKASVHNYSAFYHKIFNKKRYESLFIFELGLGLRKPGSSLRAWKDYFSNSSIYGADINKSFLFEESRIKTFYCDQDNPQKIKNMWNNNLKNLLFDVIIEDGKHDFNSNLTFLLHSFHKLKNDGYYFCEDLTEQTIYKFKKIIPSLKNTLKSDIRIIRLESENKYDNNLLLVRKQKLFL